MKLAGKIRVRELKDYGKGKDAEAHEVVVVTARLDGRAGLPSGKLELALTDEEIESGEYELGDTVVVNIDQPQQKIPGTERRRRGAAATAN